MSSKAYTDYLDVLLKDAEELGAAHSSLRTGRRGRQWGLGALNRAVVVMSVSAWEAYVEEVLKESLDAIKPSAPPLGIWPSLNAAARSQIGRFNNPNPDNVRTLVAESIGLQDLNTSWCWTGCTAEKAGKHLGWALTQRHKIAHGVKPRPVVHNKYASWLPDFFRRLGRCTDKALHDYITTTLQAPAPWPP